jgi:phage FluMu gp28-like protein
MPQAVIQQEIFAEFLEDSGVVFRGTKDIMTSQKQNPIPNHIYVMGVDLAKVQDFTVISIFDRSNNHQVYQDRFNTIEWPLQKQKIKALSRKYNNALIMLDATGLGDPIADDLIRDNLPVEPYKLTNQSKKDLIEKLIIWIEQKKFRLLPLEETLAEFGAFTYDVTNKGRISYSAPAGFHDDIVIATGLAIWSLNTIQRDPKGRKPSLVRQEYLKQLRGDYYEENYF